MKRTLNDTTRKVRIVIDNFTEPTGVEDKRWSAGASIDGTIATFEVDGTSTQEVLARIRVALEHSGELDDPLVPLPEKDKTLLRRLLHNVAETWGSAEEVPDWRSNEYARGQIELIVETCRVLTDEEWHVGETEHEDMKDRVWTWITSRSFE